MRIEDWPRVRMLFEEALTVDPSRRSQWLANRASAELRAEVETLLAADAVRESPLDRPESALGLDAFLELESIDAPHGAGEMIGPFEVLGVLGEGRAGVVYRVRQTQPPREAALKLLRSSVWQGDAVRRFETEVRALARLSDPGIAQVYEVGELPDPGGLRRPYLVMELVEGARPITALAGEATLDEKLRLLEAFCAALAHAHQRGVLHRDLKPGNVLVDGRGRLKVIDFGIARVEGEGPRATMTGQLLGTPAYMSPEQTAGQEADTRSDVHAIGLIARELLRGEGERRPTDDLAVVLAKATARAPEARYQSVGELGEEFARVRTGAPILGRPPSLTSLVRSWVRRRRGAALATGVVLVAAALAVGALVVSARRIASANDDARETAAFLLDHAMTRLEDRIGTAAERRGLAQQLLPRIEKLERLGRPQDEAWVLGARARVLGVLGDVAQAEGRPHEALQHLQEALKSRVSAAAAAPDDRLRRADASIATVRVGDVLGDLGRSGEQRERYEQAMEIDRRLTAQAPGDVRLANNLAYSCERLSSLAIRRGDAVGALRLAREQLAIASALLDRDPDNPARLWDALCARGSYDEALHAAGEQAEFKASSDGSLAVIERLARMEPRSKRVALRHISVLHRRADDERSKDPGGAMAMSLRAETMARELARADPGDWEPRAWVLRVLLGRLSIQLGDGRVDGAFENVAPTRRALRSLIQVHPGGLDTARLRRDAAHTVSAALRAAGRGEEADAFVREVIAEMEGAETEADVAAGVAERRELLLQILLVLTAPTELERGRINELLRDLLHRDDPRSLIWAANIQLQLGDRAGASRTADRALERCTPDQTMFAEEAGRLKHLCEGG